VARVVQLIGTAVHMGHEIFPVFLSAGTDPHIAQADIRQIDRPYSLIGTNHFFNRGTSEILHLMFREKGEDGDSLSFDENEFEGFCIPRMVTAFPFSG